MHAHAVLIPRFWSHPVHGRSRSSSQDSGPIPCMGDPGPHPKILVLIPCMGDPGPPPKILILRLLTPCMGDPIPPHKILVLRLLIPCMGDPSPQTPHPMHGRSQSSSHACLRYSIDLIYVATSINYTYLST